MAKSNHLLKTPPKKSPKSIQYDLFTQFLSNDDQKVSNTTELWECIPKYFFTPKQVEKLRTSTGHSDPYKWEYTYNGLPFIVKIQPALIEGKAGEYKAYFPGVTEELVEEALKKYLLIKITGYTMQTMKKAGLDSH